MFIGPLYYKKDPFDFGLCYFRFFKILHQTFNFKIFKFKEKAENFTMKLGVATSSRTHVQ